MSKAILLNTGWTFTKEGHDEPVTLPHTWNAVDGQDGGNDYYRGTCSYTRKLEKPELSDDDRAVLQFDGVAMTAVVSLNGEKVAEHKGRLHLLRRHLPRCNAACCARRTLCPCRKRRCARQGHACCD